MPPRPRSSSATLTFRRLAFAVGLAGFLAHSVFAAEPPVAWFATGGETIYHLRGAGTAAGAPRAIVTAAYSGKVLCFDQAGGKRWEQSANRGFPFALDTGDLDGDGRDESVVASADGALYIIDPDGGLTARVAVGPTPLYAAKIVPWGDGRKGIVCGGPERVLYLVSPAGKILNSVKVPGAVTALDVGRFTPRSPPGLLVKLSLDFNVVRLTHHSLPALEPVGAPLEVDDRYQYSLVTLDADGDGRDEFALGGAQGGGLYRATGQKLFALQEQRLARGEHVYPMVLLDKIPAPGGRGEDLIGLYASTLRLYGPDGKIRREVNLPDSLAGLCYDAPSRTLLLGSGISGDDGVYRVHLDRPGWAGALAQLRPQGRLRRIVANLETFAAQVAAYQAPAYQPPPDGGQLCVVAAFSPYSPGTVAELDPARALAPLAELYRTTFPYPSLGFAGNQWLSEDWDRSHLLHGWAVKRDPRMKYRLTRSEIVAHARRLERAGLPFVWTIGHGNDPFFLSLGTVEEILQAAPTACRGFIFPEVARNDTPAYRYAIETHVKPICDLALKYGRRKIFLRSKFLFWSADCYDGLWSWILAGGKYRDVIVPAMEETYERLGDLSLSGRVGLWLGGQVTDWAARAVHDNLCYDREHQWAAPMVGSQFLRALAYQSGLGARYHLIQLSEARALGGRARFEGHGPLVVEPFLHALGKGLLPRPRHSADLLSLSPVALTMRPPSADFLVASHNSHHIAKFQSDPSWVFSRLETFWGQAPTPPHDFGFYGVGRRRQGLNFIPRFPHGFVAFVPPSTRPGDIAGIATLFTTDGEAWYDPAGDRQPAAAYAPVVTESLRTAAEKMFIHVRGEVAWTATRLDARHVRLVLIDPGYMDPADRTAVVTLRAEVVSATDILSRQPLAVRDHTLSVGVPMGILRVIDIEHRQASALP